jgi:L-ascorbate metabolism protein UlaG (beta-lactamase superfamily)
MLLYQGHASFRITSSAGVVIYIDPFAGEGYDVPADIILVTHDHGDHNQIGLVTKKDDTIIITQAEAITDKKHNTFEIKGIKVEAVQAYNQNHSVENSVGYIITVDGITVYHLGDTSTTEQMKTLAERNIRYALIPMDGRFNMDVQEAIRCARLINANINIPMHTGPFTEDGPALFCREIAQQFDIPSKLIVEAGEEIALRPSRFAPHIMNRERVAPVAQPR